VRAPGAGARYARPVGGRRRAADVRSALRRPIRGMLARAALGHFHGSPLVEGRFQKAAAHPTQNSIKTASRNVADSRRRGRRTAENTSQRIRPLNRNHRPERARRHGIPSAAQRFVGYTLTT